MFQRPLLLDITVEQNVAYGLRLRGRRDPRAVTEVLAAVGLERLAGARARTLSGGEMQRVALARALVIQPRVLLLDEPTSGVAADEKFGIMDRVMNAVRGAGVTVLFVEHDMDIVSRYAHRVIAFYDGRVIADGSPESVLASESVRRYVIGEKIEHVAA